MSNLTEFEPIDLTKKKEDEVEIELEQEGVKAEEEPQVKAEAEDDEEEGGKRKFSRAQRLKYQRDQARAEAETLRKEAEEAKAQLESFRKERRQQESQGIVQYEKRVEDSLKNAKMALDTAIESGDKSAQFDIIQEIAELTIERKRLTELKSRPVEEEKKEEKKASTDVEKHRNNPLAEEWVERNKWFDPKAKNRESKLALVIDKELAEEGYDPLDPEYWEELDRRLKESLPAKTETKKPTPAVGGQRTAAPRKVNLSVEEQALAKRLGVSYEKYAQQKIAAVEPTTNGYSRIV